MPQIETFDIPIVALTDTGVRIAQLPQWAGGGNVLVPPGKRPQIVLMTNSTIGPEKVRTLCAPHVEPWS